VNSFFQRRLALKIPTFAISSNRIPALGVYTVAWMGVRRNAISIIFLARKPILAEVKLAIIPSLTYR
jgi:hypothetical protein